MLRAEFAEIAAIAAQALRLGVAVDAADASQRACRRTRCGARCSMRSPPAEAKGIIATAPSTPIAGDSPIVRRAKERAAAVRA